MRVITRQSVATLMQFLQKSLSHGMLMESIYGPLRKVGGLIKHVHMIWFFPGPVTYASDAIVVFVQQGDQIGGHR